MIKRPDWSEPAELYATGGAFHARAARYFRFSSIAEAIRFAIEDLPDAPLRGMVIESGEDRYEGYQIRVLYDAPEFPLKDIAP